MVNEERTADSTTEGSSTTRRRVTGTVIASLGALIAGQLVGGPRRSDEESTGPSQPRIDAATTSEPIPTQSGIEITPTAIATRLEPDWKLRHLLRRAGFGAGPEELAEYGKLGLDAAIERLVDYDQIDNSALEQRLERLGLDLTKPADLGRWWLLRMIYTARPLEEKLTLFWHGVLTSAISKVGHAEPMLVQNRFLRASALGRFPDILKGITRDPAMMLWLDTASNRKGQPNENYARELMELFALGVGNYTETDVREAARAFTGWILRGQRKLGQVEARFDSRLHDSGPKTFLGQTGSFSGDDVIDIIVKQPASARFIAKKLFTFFVHPEPSEDELAPLIAAYRSQNNSIKALVRAILTSEAFFSPRAYRALVKSPAEFVAGTVRVLSLETDGTGLARLAALMGQELFNPPNVAGWPGGPAWLSSGTWLARLNFANLVTSLPATGSPSGREAAAGPEGSSNPPLTAASDPAEVVDHLTEQLLDGTIAPEQRQVLIGYLTPPGGGVGGAGRGWLDERRRGVIYLSLAMPEYHLS